MDLFHALRALILAVWAAMTPSYAHVNDAEAIASGIAQAVVDDGARAPVYSSHVHDAAVMAYWAARESTLNLHARNSTERSWGAWQQDARYGGKGSAYVQARAWLWMLHQGKRICPDRPSAIAWGTCHARDVLTGRDVADLAAEREVAARELLTRAMASRSLFHRYPVLEHRPDVRGVAIFKASRSLFHIHVIAANIRHNAESRSSRRREAFSTTLSSLESVAIALRSRSSRRREAFSTGPPNLSMITRH